MASAQTLPSSRSTCNLPHLRATLEGRPSLVQSSKRAAFRSDRRFAIDVFVVAGIERNDFVTVRCDRETRDLRMQSGPKTGSRRPVAEHPISCHSHTRITHRECDRASVCLVMRCARSSSFFSRNSCGRKAHAQPATFCHFSHQLISICRGQAPGREQFRVVGRSTGGYSPWG